MNILVIGSGVSAIIVAKTFLEYKHKVSLIDPENYLDKEKNKDKTKKSFFPKIIKSPKFENKNLLDSIKKFKKKYNIKTKNFFLVSGLISGGLSNFWGAGLEIPDLDYLKKYSFGKLIMKEQKYINKELKIDFKRFSFFNYFYKKKIIHQMLKKKNKLIFFSKLLLAIKHYDKNKKLSFKDYDKIDLLSGNNNYVYNSKFEIPYLLQNENFTYIPNTFIENIKKENGIYKLISDKGILANMKFDKIIISTGTIGSTILVDRILKYSEKYKLFHTPILKLMYFSFLLPFKISSKIKFNLPLLKLNINLKKEKFCGSFIHLNTISNNFFKVSKFNIFFTFIKKFIFVGNIFLPSNYSNTYIDIKGKKTFIYSKPKNNEKIIITLLKKKLNTFLSNFNLFEFSPQNLKFLQNGSDAHYTSTLVSKHINNKKILNSLCELNNHKNIHVIDGSCIKEGLHFPTYFLMLYARFISKKIILNEKKN